MANKFGLERDIPAAVKRAVRQRDGFGCILCGNAIIDYEHFDPEFHDAQTHDPSGIILLCVGCHNRKTRGRISRSTIEATRLSPQARKQGFSADMLDADENYPTVLLGNTIIERTPIILQMGDDILLRVAPPEEKGAPFRLGASLNDGNGQNSLLIVDNEWRASSRNWDVECVGNLTTIRSGMRSIEMRFRTIPPNHLIFEDISLLHRGTKIEASIRRPTRFTLKNGSVFYTDPARISDCYTGIVVKNEAVGLGGRGGSVYQFKTEDLEAYISSISKSGENKNTSQTPDNIVPFPRPKR